MNLEWLSLSQRRSFLRTAGARDPIWDTPFCLFRLDPLCCAGAEAEADSRCVTGTWHVMASLLILRLTLPPPHLLTPPRPQARKWRKTLPIAYSSCIFTY